MTTHELAKELLEHPDVPLRIEGWTGDEILIASPFGDEGADDWRMLTSPPDEEGDEWLSKQPMRWVNIPKP